MSRSRVQFPDAEWWVASDVAWLMNVTPETVRQWDRRGVLRARTRTESNIRLFHRDDVRAFADRRRQMKVTPPRPWSDVVSPPA